MIDSFSGEATKGNLTRQNVTDFYDKILSNLEKQNYLSKVQVEAIKKSTDYQKHVEGTIGLININTPGLEGKDKICYQVAQFVKAIKLPTIISDYFLSKITPEKLRKIHTIEIALSHSIEVSFRPQQGQPAKPNTERLQKLHANTRGTLNTRGR